jgi:hypothetical protein
MLRTPTKTTLQDTYMSAAEIGEWYGLLKIEHETYLAQYGVRFPLHVTSKAVALVFLRKYQGHAVPKGLLNSFMETVIPNTNANHLTQELVADGWYITNKENITLVTVKNPHPEFKKKER